MGHRKQHTSAERQRRFLAGEFVIYDEGKPRPRRQQPALQRRKRVEPPPYAAIDHRFRGRRLSPEIVEQRRLRNRVAKRQRKINRPRRKRTNLVPLLWLLAASMIIGGAGGGLAGRAEAAVMGAPLTVTVTWVGGDCWSRFGTKPNDYNPRKLAPFYVPGCHDVSIDRQVVLRGDYFGIDPDIGDAYAVSCLVRNTANGVVVATDYAQKNDGHNATCLGRWTA